MVINKKGECVKVDVVGENGDDDDDDDDDDDGYMDEDKVSLTTLYFESTLWLNVMKEKHHTQKGTLVR